MMIGLMAAIILIIYAIYTFQKMSKSTDPNDMGKAFDFNKISDAVTNLYSPKGDFKNLAALNAKVNFNQLSYLPLRLSNGVRMQYVKYRTDKDWSVSVFNARGDHEGTIHNLNTKYVDGQNAYSDLHVLLRLLFDTNISPEIEQKYNSPYTGGYASTAGGADSASGRKQPLPFNIPPPPAPHTQ